MMEVSLTEVFLFIFDQIVVGSGGLGGTAGTFIDERVDVNALREETVARRRRQMFMSLEERIADNKILAEADDEKRRAEKERLSREMLEVLEEAKRNGNGVEFEEDADPVPGLMIDPARGIALGGRPGGGRGYGGVHFAYISLYRLRLILSYFYLFTLESDVNIYVKTSTI